MDEERESETPEHADEFRKGLSDEIMAYRGGELFGDPSTAPSFYYCPACDDDVLAQDVVWDRNDQPHCPDCDGLLQRRSRSGDVPA